MTFRHLETRVPAADRAVTPHLADRRVCRLAHAVEQQHLAHERHPEEHARARGAHAQAAQPRVEPERGHPEDDRADRVRPVRRDRADRARVGRHGRRVAEELPRHAERVEERAERPAQQPHGPVWAPVLGLALRAVRQRHPACVQHGDRPPVVRTRITVKPPVSSSRGVRARVSTSKGCSGARITSRGHIYIPGAHGPRERKAVEGHPDVKSCSVVPYARPSSRIAARAVLGNDFGDGIRSGMKPSRFVDHCLFRRRLKHSLEAFVYLFARTIIV